MNDRAYSRDDLRVLLEALDVPMAASLGQNLDLVNDAYARALGFTREELEGRPYVDLLLPEERTRLLERAKVLASGVPYVATSYPVLILGKERPVHFLVRMSFLRAAEGGRWAVSTCLELSESERSQKLADLLTAVSAEMIAARSESGARAAATSAFATAGLTARFYSDPANEAMKEAMATRRPVFLDARGSFPGGVVLPIERPFGVQFLELTGRGLYGVHAPTLSMFARVVATALDSSGMIAELAAHGRESERRLEQTQLMLDLARTTSGTLELSAVLDAASDFLVRLLDVSNCFILLYDERARMLRGAAASSAHREFFRSVEIPIENPGVAGTAARERRPVAIEDTSTWTSPGRMDLVQRFDEKAVLALPLTSRDELLGVVVVDDTRGPRQFDPSMTKLAQACIAQVALSVANARLYESLRKSYAELAATRAEMVKRERLAALGELAAVVAHEVRNPLGVIFNAVSSLRRLAQMQGDAELLLGIIIEESDRLNRIVGDLLDFARPRALSMQLEDVARIVRETVDAAQADRVLAARVRFRAEVSPGLPQVPVDRHLLRQALVNVTVNAMQSMPSGGTITVSARRDPVESERYVRIEVTDEGPGIPTELLPRVFEPFFTTKARGTGLGLAVVKRIVEDHRGEVLVRSEAGRGTTFAFRLPVPSGAMVE